MNFKTSRVGLFDLTDMTNYLKSDKKVSNTK